MRDHRHVLVALVRESHQEAYKDLLEGLWVVNTVYTSRKKINVDHYKGFCFQVYLGILENFGNLEAFSTWLNIGLTVHSLLAHSWELIERIGGLGLGEHSESGLECNNKYLRSIRTSLSRKTSQEACLEDTLVRLWLKLNPLIRSFRPRRNHRLYNRTENVDSLENPISKMFV